MSASKEEWGRKGSSKGSRLKPAIAGGGRGRGGGGGSAAAMEGLRARRGERGRKGGDRDLGAAAGMRGGRRSRDGPRTGAQEVGARWLEGASIS